MKFSPSSFDTHTEEVKFLKKLGFNTPEIITAKDTTEVWQKAQEVKENKDKYEYNIDGAVVKINDNRLTEQLGAIGKTPRTWAAIKFPANETTSRITAVTWQVGRTGRLTPVAELEAAELDGTTIRRATLHNMKELDQKDIHLNDTLVIHKAGDIIPEVVQVITGLREPGATKIQTPTTCPDCGSELILSETEIDLICTNTTDCKSQILGKLKYYTQRNIANINGLSEKTLELFIEEFSIRDIQDLYDLDYGRIFELEGWGKKSVDKLKENIDKSKNISATKFLAGLGIEGVGIEVAKLVVSKIAKKN